MRKTKKRKKAGNFLRKVQRDKSVVAVKKKIRKLKAAIFFVPPPGSDS